MKTLHTTTDRSNVQIREKSNRSFLTVAGILTAVLCSIALWYDAKATNIDTKAPRLLLLETPKTVML